MFQFPLPRRSFLDSPLRLAGHENRRLAHDTAVGGSHLGKGHRVAPARPAVPGKGSESRPGSPRARA